MLSFYEYDTRFSAAACVCEAIIGSTLLRHTLSALSETETEGIWEKGTLEHRATRFGFQYLETLLAGQGCSIEVVNLAENDKDDLLYDLTSIIYFMCARLYGQRRAKKQTQLIAEQRSQEA